MIGALAEGVMGAVSIFGKIAMAYVLVKYSLIAGLSIGDWLMP